MERVTRKYLDEFTHFDGINFVTFNIVELDTANDEIIVAVTNEGKTTVRRFELKSDGKRQFFEFGTMLDEIDLDDFERVD